MTYHNLEGDTCSEAVTSRGTCPDALPEGTVLLNGQYTIERYLGSGGFGITYFARDSLNRRVVIKECFPEAFCSRDCKSVIARSRSHQNEIRSVVEMFVREAHAIAKLEHPNIVRVHQIFEDNQTAYMALDLIDGSDLLDLIELGDELLSPREVKALLLKVLDAVSTVHDQDMLHRDISPDNILIDTWGNPVLIDFGAAREEASKKSRVVSALHVVKDGYSPQEFYISGSKQAPCSDLYALAATFYHLISGHAPPNSQSRLADIAANKPDPYHPLAGRIDGYEPEFLDAIDTAMRVFPSDRMQSAQEWILKIDEKKRLEFALAHARCDKKIEDTVQSMILEAQNDVAPVSTPDPVEKPVAESEAKCTEKPKPTKKLDVWSIDQEFLPAYRTLAPDETIEQVMEDPQTDDNDSPVIELERGQFDDVPGGPGQDIPEAESESLHAACVAGASEKPRGALPTKDWINRVAKPPQQSGYSPDFFTEPDTVVASEISTLLKPTIILLVLIIITAAFVFLFFERQLASFAWVLPITIDDAISLSSELITGVG